MIDFKNNIYKHTYFILILKNINIKLFNSYLYNIYHYILQFKTLKYLLPLHKYIIIYYNILIHIYDNITLYFFFNKCKKLNN